MKTQSPRDFGDLDTATAVYRAEWEDGNTLAMLLAPDGTILDLNQRMVEIFGMPYEVLKGSLVWDRVAPTGRSARQAVLNAVIETRTPQRFESEHKGRWYESLLRPYLDMGGRMVAISMTIQDITEKRRASEALSASEEKYRLLFEHAGDAIFILNDDLQPLAVNPVAVERFGYTREELMSMTMYEIDAPEPRERVSERREIVMARGFHMFEAIHQRKDGSRIQAEVNARRITWDGQSVILCISRDITDRKNAESALKEGEHRFQTMFRFSPIPTAMSRFQDGRYVNVNDAFLGMYGYTREEVLGRTSAELGLWPEAEERRELIRRLEAAGAAAGFEAKYRTKSGNIGDCLISAALVEVAGQRHLFGMILDITERKRLEVALREAQKMEAIGHLTGGMAHEFNNILASMMMSLSLMKMGNIPSETRRMVEDLVDSSHRAAGLIKQLLAFSGKSVMRVRALDWGECVSSQCVALRTLLGDRISLVFSDPGHLPQITADQSMLEQALRTLCLNARDAIGQQCGEIRVSLEQREITPEQVPARSEVSAGPFVCLMVTDTGCGMDQATLDRLFEPFFTTKDVGQATGLGLAAVRGIVDQHRGWVEVDSIVGKGSTFRVFLPARGQTSTESRLQHGQPCSGRGGNAILIVEDNLWLRKPTASLLAQNGYVVLEAATADEAVEVWNRRGGEIDLLYSDVMMPGSMTGLQLAERLLAERPGLKVILTSGCNLDSTDLSRGLGASVIYLPKPCPVETILSAIRDSLKRS